MWNKKLKKSVLGISFASFLLVLGACGNTDDENMGNTENTETMDENMEGMDHGNMDMSTSGEVPEGLKTAESPTYEVGTSAMINADHMEGMNGAEARIVGAYDTTVYTVSYTPTTGGERVEDHKWVIHEELQDAGEAPLESGTEVTVNADHMEGMEGATAEIDSAEETTIYMVDYTPTTGGEKVINHQWVTESELSPVQ
ncbi:YdhK family protein [Domibacillus enclensis]|uniref:DUF1541 domain-containing protein n=1 Tax=Domibacillus enclensis TaxID=1017273 RepID=A0A1N6W0E6_9BACI|nr:YdhK family protein [Domibacillus enclensis]OXS77815.1 hypothetical protein B1B05_09415 [Domibacillus enclensis]SIQ83601.1 Protein of unknown function [Domibacillus enclensis]